MAGTNFWELLASAREAIKAEKLPATTNPDEVQGSHVIRHSGPCDHFGAPIEAGTVRHDHPLIMGKKTNSLHFLCHAAWQVAAADLEGMQAGS